MDGQPVENDAPILAGIFVLEELDTPEKDEVTYDDMVRCILSAQWRVGNGEEPYPAATQAIKDHFDGLENTQPEPGEREASERDHEAMEVLRTRKGILAYGTQEIGPGEAVEVWTYVTLGPQKWQSTKTERNDPADAILSGGNEREPSHD